MELDPGAWDEKSFQLWKQAGVNRVSIGVQSFDPNGLNFLDRSHNYQDVIETLEYFSLEKINFSVDFMIGLGLPDTNRNIVKELEEILAYHPNHISLYILTVGNHYPLKKFIPEDEIISNEYQIVDEFLSSQGFNHYEVSNYAKPGFESKHNQQYWLQNSVAGIGPSASGFMKKDATKATRYKWAPGKGEMIFEELNLEQIWLEKIYLTLRTSRPWKLQEILLNSEQTEKYEKILEGWSLQGLVNREREAYQMNAKSWIILDCLVRQLL
jgi:oxygen-independent coproporphyrinogen-3 oxidase